MTDNQRNIIIALIALSLFIIWSSAKEQGKELNYGLLILGYGIAFMLSFVIPTVILVVLSLTTLYVAFTMGVNSMKWLNSHFWRG